MVHRVMGHTYLRIPYGAVVLAVAVLPRIALAQDAGTKKTFFDYILPTPITCALTTKTWGCTAAQVAAKQNYCGNEAPPQVSGPVVPRDTCNGMESAKDPPDNYYWDGKIIRAADGIYHMISDRWPDANQGFQNYTSSAAVHATSNSPLGPYTETGYCYSFWSSGDSHRGHNTTAIQLLDGTYALTTGEGGVAPFAVWTSPSLAGPWTACPNVKPDATSEIIDTNGLNLSSAAFPSTPTSVRGAPGWPVPNCTAEGHNWYCLERVRPLQAPATDEHLSIGSATSVWHPEYLSEQKEAYGSIGWNAEWTTRDAAANLAMGRGSRGLVQRGKYHVLYDYPIDRVGYHLTSVDGIHNWTDEGFAYDPRIADKDLRLHRRNGQRLVQNGTAERAHGEWARYAPDVCGIRRGQGQSDPGPIEPRQQDHHHSIRWCALRLRNRPRAV